MTLLMRDKMNIEQGIEREKERTIRAMLKRNFPDEEILEISGISAAQLAEIRKNM